MNTDEQFNIWFFDACNFDRDSSQHHWARQAYFEATERAALVCEAIASQDPNLYEAVADDCANAIRGKK